MMRLTNIRGIEDAISWPIGGAYANGATAMLDTLTMRIVRLDIGRAA